MEENFIRENLTTPITYRCRVLVAGGGVAGIAAALAAARRGADVLLIEREYALGGLATLGLVTYYLPLCDGMGHQVIYGIGEELLRLSVKHGAEADYPSAWFDDAPVEEKLKKRYKAGYNGPLFMMETERLLLESGVRILYGTSAVAAKTEDEDTGMSRITHVICENKSGRFAVACDCVIDCSGDADIAKFAGARTALFGQGNILAAWYYYIDSTRRKCRMLGAADIPDADKAAGAAAKPVLAERRFGGLDGQEISEMVCLSHAATYGEWQEKHAADPSYLPDVLAAIPQLRMTRRIVGTAEPDTADNRREFADTVGLTGHWRKKGPVYEIPFGALRSVNVRNLLAAGRDISVTDALWDNTRVIPTCAVTGEAAGAAAAMFTDFSAVESGSAELAELQRELRSGGVRLTFAEVGL